jgi:TolA-binding protein
MKSWIFIGVLIALMSGAVYYYYTTTQAERAFLISENATLVSNNVTLMNANNQNVQTIEDLQVEFQRVQDDFMQVQSEFQVIRSQNSELKERLGRHELDVLASVRPVLVERTLNNATQNALRCFELLSGAPLNDRERNAQNERQFNSECPWMWLELTQ